MANAKEFNKPDPSRTRRVPDSSQNITREKLKSVLPKNSGVQITDEVLRLISTMEEDIDIDQTVLEEDIMSYMFLLGNSTNSIKDLVNAVKFCNLKRHYDNRTAWAIVFPDKYEKAINENKYIDSRVSTYNNSRLVIAIDKEMLIPVHIQYAGHFHAAVKKQFELMNGISSAGKGKTTPMVEHLAAKELALLTAQPVETKIDLKVSPSDAALGAMGEMNEQLKQIVAKQKRDIDAGMDIIDAQVIGIDFSDVGRDKG